MSEEIGAVRPAVFTIPSHRSFADALAAGLIKLFGGDSLALARGRILLPNNRAVRSVTEAFVRASGSGLLLPRLIPVGDPELEERVGGALDTIDDGEAVPPAIEPTERLLRLASVLRGEGSAEALRLAADLARTLDALLVEKVDPHRLKEAVAETSDLAAHWEKSLQKLDLIYQVWPAILRDEGAIDLAERRNILLRRLVERWKDDPPPGFTVAAGITTAAPAVAALVAQVARMPDGMAVLPGLWLGDVFPDEEWDALGPATAAGRDPPAISFKAVSRPDGSWPRRSEEVALVGPGGFPSGPSADGSECDGLAALLA